MKFEESFNVIFDESPPSAKTSPLEDDDLVEEEVIKNSEKKPIGNDVKNETLEIDEIVNIKESKSDPLENVIGNLNQRTLRSQAQDKSGDAAPYLHDTIVAEVVHQLLDDTKVAD
ncbi:hypothetical protein Tco_0503637 [Tanacetum coccineum]